VVVQDDEVGLDLPGLLHAFDGLRRGLHVVALALEDLGEDGDDLEVVVDDEHLRHDRIIPLPRAAVEPPAL
jgi:hypothetical protein